MSVLNLIKMRNRQDEIYPVPIEKCYFSPGNEKKNYDLWKNGLGPTHWKGTPLLEKCQ